MCNEEGNKQIKLFILENTFEKLMFINFNETFLCSMFIYQMNTVIIFGSCYDDDDEGFIIGFAYLLFGYMICFYFKLDF